MSEWLFNSPYSEAEVKSAQSPVKHFVADQACSLKRTIPRIGQAQTWRSTQFANTRTTWRISLCSPLCQTTWHDFPTGVTLQATCKIALHHDEYMYI
jgi:hypothetical protein